MGGLRHTRNRGDRARTRTARRVALWCAVAALTGLFLVCLASAGGGTDPIGGGGRTHAAAPAPAYNCPYDQGDCGVFAHVSPAILTVPPPDAPPGTVTPPVRREAEGGAAGVRRGGEVWARAPGAHVLMVLRR